MAVVGAASGPGAVIFGTVAGIYDVGLFLNVRADCIQAVYGK
jgi:hypothetical protein